MDEKEQKALNELNRVEYERERRKTIKDVREEAHELSAARRRKAEEFRKQRVNKLYFYLMHCYLYNFGYHIE